MSGVRKTDPDELDVYRCKSCETKKISDGKVRCPSCSPKLVCPSCGNKLTKENGAWPRCKRCDGHPDAVIESVPMMEKDADYENYTRRGDIEEIRSHLESALQNTPKKDASSLYGAVNYNLTQLERALDLDDVTKH